MQDNELLLLGLLMSQSQHGYQITEFIEKNLAHFTDIKKSNAYATLERLDREGYIGVHLEQLNNRPQRKVYSITEAGKDYFNDLLQHNLSTADQMNLSGSIGLMFVDNLSIPQAINCLEQKMEQIKALIAAHENLPAHGAGIGVDLSMERYMALLRADEAWLAKAIEDLKGRG